MGKTIIGVDASRNRSGGALNHIVGLVTEGDPREFGIKCVHLWGYEKLLDNLPSKPWLVKHKAECQHETIVRQLWWQWENLPEILKTHGCSLLFNTDAGSVCPFQPSITLSQDMLSFEPGEMERYGYSKARLRLIVLKYVQARSLTRSIGAIFLTNYAADLIQASIGKIENKVVIPHGIGEAFHKLNGIKQNEESSRKQLIYVSNSALYKHQWNVIEAVASIRRKGHDVFLLLVGGGEGRAQHKVDIALKNSDPDGQFISQISYTENTRIPDLLKNSDICIFASSCENLPITLLESMAAGLPIACSNRGPMPEVLGEAGIYFDPEDVNSLVLVIEKLLIDPGLADDLAIRAKKRSNQFTWHHCARQTWKFLAEQMLSVS